MLNLGNFIDKCFINSLVVHPKFDKGATGRMRSAGRTLATPGIDSQGYQIQKMRRPNLALVVSKSPYPQK
jgi:hypothetical protein